MKMKNYFVLFMVSVFFLVVPISAFASGDIQITCEPGIRIWLDNEFQGKTTVDDMGLFLENISPGEHEIKAAKKGFTPVIKKVLIKRGQTLEVNIKFATPSIRVEDISPERSGALEREIGTLVLRSAPLNAEIFLDGKSIGKGDKQVNNLPAARERGREGERDGHEKMRFFFCSYGICTLCLVEPT
jgi:hypothetical protein